MARILVVDDEPAVIEGLVAYLSGSPTEIETAHTFEDARARIESGDFELVLSDLRMSDPGGMEGLALLEISRRLGPVRFALMTGYLSPEVEREAKRLGADALLTKPLDLALLDRFLADAPGPGEVVSTATTAEAPFRARRPGARLSDADAARLLARYVESRDEVAIETLVKAFAPLVHSIPIKWYRLQRSEAEDVFQEVMVHLLENAATIRNVRLWLIGTAVNCTRRRFASAQRSGRLAELWALESSRLGQVHVEAEDDLRTELRQSVASLPERQRAFVEAIYYEGLSYRDVAVRFEMPLGSIGPTRGRIVRTLTSTLRPESEGRRGHGH